jgi:PST family polysaccharide transporter
LKHLSILKGLINNNKTQVENLVSLILIQVVNTLIPFFLFPYLVKVLGQVQYGQAAFITSFINFLQIIIDFGFNYTGTRLVALAKDRSERSKVFYGIITIKLFLFIISVIILLITAIFVTKVREVFDLFIISSTLMLGNVLFPVWFFQGMEKMKIIGILNIVTRVASLIMIVMFVKSPLHTERYIIINAISSLLPAIFCFSYCIYKFRIQFKLPSYVEIKAIFLDGKDLFLSNLIIGGYSSIRIFVVGLFSTGELLGVYSILERIYFIIQSFPLSSFLQATYPKLVKEVAINKQKVINFMKLAANYSVIYFVIAVVIFIIFQRWILEDLLNVKLPDNYLTLSIILGIILILVNYNTFKLEYLLISGNDKLYRVIHFFTGIFGATTLILFTYLWGITGCALSVLLTQTTIVIYTFYIYKKKLGFVI